MILRATPNFRHLSAALLVLGALGCVDETFDEESQAHPNSIVGGPTCFTEDPGSIPSCNGMVTDGVFDGGDRSAAPMRRR